MELIIQTGADTGKVFQVGPNPQVAGRQTTTDIVLNDNQISRRHAQFELINGALVVTDLGSANGTRVNGELLPGNTPRQLRPGDQIQLGDTVLAVSGVPDSQQATEFVRVPAPAPTAAPPPPAQDDYVPGQAWQNTPAASVPADAPVVSSPPPAQFNSVPADAPAQSGSVPPDAPVLPDAGFNSGAAPANFQAAPTPGYAPQPPAQYAPSPGGYAPQPPAQYAPPKKRGFPMVLVLIILVVVLGGMAAAYFLVADNSAPTPTQQSGLFVPPTSAPGAPTPAPAGPTATPVKGAAGANAVPAKPVPTTAAARRPTPTAAPTAASSAGGQNVSAIGLSLTFPEDWEIFTDERKQLIEGSSPDGVTYVQVQLLTGFKGSGVERLGTYLTNLKQNQSDVKVIRDVKALSSGSGAEAYITYTDKNDKLLHRDYIIAVPSTGTNTYILRCSTDDSKFDGQVATFNRILSSIKDS